MPGLEFPPSNQPQYLPTQPNPAQPEHIPPLVPERLMAQRPPSSTNPETGGDTSAGRSSRLVVPRLSYFSRPSPGPDPTLEAYQKHLQQLPEHELDAVPAGTPIDRLVQCSIRSIPASGPYVPNNILSGIARGLETPDDPASPLKFHYYEGEHTTHPEIVKAVGIPARDEQPLGAHEIESHYALGRSYATVGLLCGKEVDPAFADSLATATTQSLGSYMLKNLISPEEGPPFTQISVSLSVGQNATAFYKVPPAELGQFDASQETHRKRY